MKKCTKCGLTQPLSYFRYRKDRQKHQAACRECEKAYAKNYRRNNAAAVKDYEDARTQRRSSDPIFRAYARNYHFTQYRTNPTFRFDCLARASKRRALKIDLREAFDADMARHVYREFRSKCYCCGSTTRLQIDHFRPHKALPRGTHPAI